MNMSRKKFSKIKIGALLIPLILAAHPNDSTASTKTTTSLKENNSSSSENKRTLGLFENPIIGNGADPWVVKHTDGFYYYTNTTGGDVTIWKSKTLSGIEKGEKKVVWHPAANAPNRNDIWAPEMHFINGKWYIYFAANGVANNAKQRMYVLESEGSDPFGPYHHPEGTNYGQITDPSNKWAIDGTVLELEGKLYFVWSGWEGDVNVSQRLYIAPMSNPWTISGERVELSRPELPWELHGTPTINEGPQILKNKQGQVFIVYSASGSWTNDYCLGLLSLSGTDPLNPEAWTKKQEPVFQKDPALGVYGPGHNSFVKSPDGTEDWILYHAAKWDGSGWDRNVRMQKFEWNKDGTPNFGSPVSIHTLQPVPSGEADGKLVPALPGVTYKYEAEQAKVNHVRIVDNPAASGGKKVGAIDFADSFVGFNVQVPKGDYTLNVQYGSGMAGQNVSHNVSVNGSASQELTYFVSGWDTWRNAEMDVSLTHDQNVILISKGKSFAEIDSIELVPKETTVFRYEAELANLKKAEIANDALAANYQKVESKKDSKINFSFSAAKAGTYELKVRYSAEADSTQRVTTNSGLAGHVNYSNTNGDWQYTSIQVELKEGINHITLAKGTEAVEIDHIALTSNSLSD
jgi:GH43 family beta-xylosidase